MEAEIHRVREYKNKLIGYDLHIYQDKNADEALKIIMTLSDIAGTVEIDDDATALAEDICATISNNTSEGCFLDETIIEDPQL